MSSKNRKMQRKLEREIIENRRISELKKMSLGWYEGNKIIQTTCEPIKVNEGFISKLHQPIVQFGKTEAFTEAIRSLVANNGIGFIDMSRMADESYENSVTTLRKLTADIENVLMFPKIME